MNVNAVAPLKGGDFTSLRQSPATLAQIQSIVDLVAIQLGQPYVAFSVFDDRYTHYLVTHGLEGGQNPRSDVLCDIVYQQEKPMVSGDVRSDPVLGSRPVVQTMGVRFYAGAPVFASSGRKVGVLCSWGEEPVHDLPPHLLQLMKTSAELVGTLVESARDDYQHSRYQSELREQLTRQARLDAIVQQAAILVSGDGRIQYATDPFLAMIGRKQDELVGLRVSALLEATAPLGMEAALAQAADSGKPLQFTGRLRTKGQQSRIVDLKIFPSSQAAPEEGQFGIRFLDPSALNPVVQASSQRVHLLSMMRQGESREVLLNPLLQMVENQVRGTGNLAMISEITGPESRIIHASPRAASFVEDVKGHHEFSPLVSICASTADARHFFSCNDTLDESRWPNYDWLYFTHDIRSVWCSPILDPAGLIVGLVTVYRKEPGAPDKSDVQALEEAAEWAGLLMLGRRGQAEAPDGETLSAEYMSRCLSELRGRCRAGQVCYLVALDLSDINASGISPSHVEEIICLYLGEDARIFRLKPDTWYCLCVSANDQAMRGGVEGLSGAFALDRVSAAGREQARVRLAFRKADDRNHILDQIASVGRQLLRRTQE